MTNGRIGLCRGVGRTGPHDECVEVRRGLLKKPFGLLAGLVRLASEQVDGGELEGDLGIVGLELLGLEQIPE